MTLFEIIIDCVTAIGALATAGAFLYVIRGQKGTMKQIDSLSQMATMFTRQYQMARIQAGSTIYPNLKIALKHNAMWGMKIVVKNNSYPIEIYRVIINTGSDNIDISIKPREAYRTAKQGETKVILPGQIGGGIIHTYIASIKLFIITPFEEAYEIRYSTDGGQQQYQSDPIPIIYRQEDHESGTEPTYTVKRYSIHGHIPGTVEDNFPEISKEFEDDVYS